jgi:DNA mismatch repair ATPase MutS
MTILDKIDGSSKMFICVDNLGQGTNALNSMSLALAYLESISSLISKETTALVSTCMPLEQTYLPVT